MNKRAEEFRERAAVADEKAEKANDLEAREAFHEIAKHWRAMADHAERRGW